MTPAERIRAAHADAWAAEGRARAPLGGGTRRVQHARAMASGIPDARWNNADITGADPDVGALHAWYTELGMPWGVRVPVELADEVTVGEELFVKRSFGLEDGSLVAGDDADGLDLRVATPDELDRFVAAEMILFDDTEATARAWIVPVFGREGFAHWLATRGGEIVAAATAVRTDEVAGPAVMLTGLASVPGEERSRQALARAVVARAFDDEPGTLVHAHTGPGDDTSDLVDVGFVEVPGFVVRSVSGGT